MFEILLFLRRIVRFVLKFILFLSVICMLSAMFIVTPVKYFIVYVVMTAGCILGLIYYDRMLFKMAEKQGIDLYL